MNLFPIAASDMDVVIGIIAVVGWILAQIFGRKNSTTPTEAPPRDSTQPVNPQDELRKFFEEMEKTLKPQPEPKPAGPIQPPPIPSFRQHLKPKPERPQVRVLEPIPVVAQISMDPLPRTTGTGPVVTSTVPPRPPAIEGLDDPLALRKMIVTMEILGKPVALR